MHVTVLGVPNSAGAYCVGVERAPDTLRRAGLIEALERSAHEVHDAGDLTTRRWSPDLENRYAQNLGDEVEALRELSDAAARLLGVGRRLLVLGGSCTVAVGMCSAMAAIGERPRIVYIDRHLDLNTPQSTTEGSFSWMGMAHALALPGCASELAEATGRSPLLDPADLVYLGADVNQATEWERSQLQAQQIAVVDQAELCAHPGAAARAAHDVLATGPFVIHVDVDVLDFLDAPIAENVNGRNSGPTIAQLGQALGELLQHPDCLGMSIGQLDPAHAEADPTAVPRLIEAVGSAFAPSAAHA